MYEYIICNSGVWSNNSAAGVICPPYCCCIDQVSYLYKFLTLLVTISSRDIRKCDGTCSSRRCGHVRCLTRTRAPCHSNSRRCTGCQVQQ